MPPPLRATNSDGALTFDFLSDDSVVSSGWDASFRSEQPLVTTATLITCDGVITDSGGSGAFYSADENFELVLMPSDPEARLELQFLAFDTESGSDYLSLFHGSSGGLVLAGTYSGTAFPMPVTSRALDGSLTLIWASGPLVNRPGWVAAVGCVHPIRNDIVTACGARLTDTGGRFEGYLDNEDLVQDFEPAMPRSRIRFGFQGFQSEDGFDQLKIHDGGSLGPQIGVLQGSPAMPAFIAGSDPSGRMGLVWHSDVSGFFAGYEGIAACDPPLVVDEFEGGDLLEWAAKTP